MHYLFYMNTFEDNEHLQRESVLVSCVRVYHANAWRDYGTQRGGVPNTKAPVARMKTYINFYLKVP